MARKLSVQVSADKHRLLLSWSREGTRFRFFLHLSDTPANREVARQVAAKFEAALADGRDPRESFRSPLSLPQEPQEVPIALVGFFRQFCNNREVDFYTQQKYKALATRLTEFFGDKVLPCSLEEAKQFLSWLSQFQSPKTKQDRLALLRACWDWGLSEKLVVANPWRQIKFRCPPLRPRRPFTAEELGQILSFFDGHLPDYALYIRFLALTGCRIAEAVGLRWSSISEGCESVWIGEVVVRGGRRKSTKTNRDRIFPCNDSLKSLLGTLRRPDMQPDALVFPSPSGGPIESNSFCQRIWQPALKKAGVTYRCLYNLRHSFISHCLQRGMAPVEVATITGHDVGTLYKNYAGCVCSRPQVPDFLS